ncbi:hypothetical protein C0Q70_11756 [Pomacea canaliculata]|uniref:Uncharacterized protein n=1 Tax=Pomacea canaliculata TaxID=400727 RepID=A0A2T7P6X9_POMCA|nr:hypothetical protein C0Q70_11756 [Pomacea canaliculata]
MATGSVAQARPAGTRIPVVGSAKPTTLSASSLPVPQTVGSKSKITFLSFSLTNSLSRDLSKISSAKMAE